jgi:acyl-CoA synthetase (AMP-forming)/AMP-acid ligase II
MVTKGYFRNEKATRDMFTADGWFCTSDIGLRKNGKFYIVDRKKVCLPECGSYQRITVTLNSRALLPHFPKP